MRRPIVVGGVEHAAVGVAPAVDQVLAGFFSGRGEHDRAAEVLGEDRLRPLGPEVAEVHDQGVRAALGELLERLEGVRLVLDDRLDLDDGKLRRPALFRHFAAPLARELDGEAVAADGDQADFDDRHVLHFRPLLFASGFLFCP